MFSFLTIIVCGILGADAGGSCWWSKKWEDKESGGIMPIKLTFMPELILALAISIASVSVIAPFIFSHLIGISGGALYVIYFLWFILALALSYGGIQTGHAAILPHQNVDHLPKGRDNFLTPHVISLAKFAGIEWETKDRKSYTEAYVWLFWALKGFIITLPIGGFGFIGLPVGYEIGSHFGGREKYWRYNPHFVSEFTGYALAVGLSLSTII